MSFFTKDKPLDILEGGDTANSMTYDYVGVFNSDRAASFYPYVVTVTMADGTTLSNITAATAKDVADEANAVAKRYVKNLAYPLEVRGSGEASV